MPDPFIQRQEYLRRRNHRLLAHVPPVVLGLAVVASAISFLSPDPAFGVTDRSEPNIRSTFLSGMGPVRDTLYTAMPTWIEIDLDRQLLVHHHRNGRLDTIPISSGTAALPKGVETREGVFVVQNKIEWLYSLQFDSTKVYNWLGFNFGIGLHSLDGRGYYRHLGRRASSHGCVRVGTEDARALFSTVAVGTPVLVHRRTSARTVAFLPDTTGAFTAARLFPADVARSLHERRLHDVYLGLRLQRDYPVIPLSRATVTHSGLPTGESWRVPDRQRLPVLHSEPTFATRVRTSGIAQTNRPSRTSTHPSSDTDSDMQQVVLP